MVNKFKVIEVMNKAMIELLNEKHNNCEANIKIQENLKDEAYFFKIEKEKAFDILKKVGVKEEQLENVYRELISSDIFFDLVRKGIINQEDGSLIVKYKNYVPGELFNK